MLMNSRKERLRLWRFDGFPAVRVRAAEQVANHRSRLITFHVSTGEFRTAVRPDVLERVGAIINLRENWLTVHPEEPEPA
jgi:hypothetical protein